MDKKDKKIITIGIIITAIITIILTAIQITAFSTIEITAPAAFSYQETLLVNISGSINASGFPFLNNPSTTSGGNYTVDVVNITILNHSGSSTDAYGILAASLPLLINATNDTTFSAVFWNFSATLTNERHWIKLNFTNVSRNDDGSFGGALSAERIIQIDVSGNILNVGGFDTINLSLDTGDINTSGGLHISKNISMLNTAGNRFTCGINNAGTFSCVAE